MQAITALSDHRLRTALSILGITIGIAAVMAVSTVSKGGNYIVYSELETFGLNSVWVYRNWRDESPNANVRPGSGIDTDDYQAIVGNRERLGVNRISPLVDAERGSGRVRNKSRYARASVVGVSASYTDIVNDTLASGRGFFEHDITERRHVAILAPEVANRLFTNGTKPIGQTIRYQNRRFQVVGVLQAKSRDFLASIGSDGGQNANDRVLIPFTTMQRINGNNAIGHFQIEVADFDRAAQTAQSVTSLLEQRHRGQFRYQYETMASYISTTNRILGGVAVVGIVAASISLLVGGMGILNMMSTAVLERTREIGIRRAIGASSDNIRNQFLLEAVLISVIGGLLGLLFGVVISIILATVTGFPLIPSPVTITGALVVSIIVGILSGYLPARRAAKLHPVEALRSQ